ncbi:cutinase family protein [Mycobacterium heidelbergense]|uniref:cutinase family protein n=1 Tax=Mycobacterium heidelbergense TaxID=53376 RepID=UPI003CF0D1C9
MILRHIARLISVAVFTTAATLGAPIETPSVSAAPCADVDVVFARGTGEPAGIGQIGQAFVDALRLKVGGKSLAVYAVNYPATLDFPTAIDGVNDAGNHVEQMAVTCPDTKMVLGGFSQGAAVMGFVTSAAIPDGAPPDAPKPMPRDVADHVAAITLFGMPSSAFMNSIAAPPIVIGPLYLPKTTELCAPGDPVCSHGGDWGAHNEYANDGMVNQAATFAALHLASNGSANWQQMSRNHG